MINVVASPDALWQLDWFDGRLSEPVVSQYFSDPATPIAMLAKLARDNWSLMPALYDVPDTAPASDLAAVAMFFCSTASQLGKWFELARIKPADVPPGVAVDETPGAPLEWTHVISNSYKYWLCPCGNHSEADGFSSCNPDGSAIYPESEHWGGLFCCDKCGRIIDQLYGEIVGQVAVSV